MIGHVPRHVHDRSRGVADLGLLGVYVPARAVIGERGLRWLFLEREAAPTTSTAAAGASRSLGEIDGFRLWDTAISP
jgi:hypothetical protein